MGIEFSTKIEEMRAVDPVTNQGVNVAPELCDTHCYPNAGSTEVHTRVSCTKLCTFKAIDIASENSAMCYVHKLMQCQCRDADAESGTKTQMCGAWQCEVQKTATPEG